MNGRKARALRAAAFHEALRRNQRAGEALEQTLARIAPLEHPRPFDPSSRTVRYSRDSARGIYRRLKKAMV